MLKIYSNGMTLSFPRKTATSKPGIKSKSVGWSESSTRSNTHFLYSVDTNNLTGFGYAFTFTIRDLPPSPVHWYEVRQRFFKRLKRMGLIRYHWVTEWQRRGVPHLHGCLYFPSELHINDIRKILSAWCKSASGYVASYKAQDIKKIDSAVGWLQYLAKHGSRSKYHYQRSSKPSEWDSSGRVWGKGGEWPVRLTEHATANRKIYRLRRLMKRWRIADARKPQPFTLNGYTYYPDNPDYWLIYPTGCKNPRRIRQARRCLKSNDVKVSAVRGMSEWIPEELAFKMIGFIESNE